MVNQVANQDGLETAHVHFPVMAVLDVREISGVAAAVVWMTIGPARASVSCALAFSHADPMHVEVGDVLGCILGFIRCIRQSGEHHRKHNKTANSSDLHESLLASNNPEA